jgi:hypothetical protein
LSTSCLLIFIIVKQTKKEEEVQERDMRRVSKEEGEGREMRERRDKEARYHQCALYCVDVVESTML